MKKVLKVIGILALILIIGSGGMIAFMSRGLSEGREMVIHEVDLLAADDGVYEGSYQGGRWSNRLAVTIKDHEITQIEIRDDVRFSDGEVSQQILNSVMEKQSTQVDVVSGATVTSKAYLHAVEDALSRQPLLTKND